MVEKEATAAKIREIDVVKFICMRESLVARLKTVTRAMRAMAKKIRFSRIKKDNAPDAKLVLKLESQCSVCSENWFLVYGKHL